MRGLLILTALGAIVAAPASAFGQCECGGGGVGLPEPTRSTVEVSGATRGCQFRFRADSGLDQMVVDLTLRDSFDQPICDCAVSVTLAAAAGSPLCGCEPLQQTGVTAADGTASFVFSRIGGHGQLTVDVMSHCCGDIVIASIPVTFTSPDLDASCEPEPGSSTGVIDLGIFIAGFPPSPLLLRSDYDCSGAIGIPDLGIWAGGLTRGCAAGP